MVFWCEKKATILKISFYVPTKLGLVSFYEFLTPWDIDKQRLNSPSVHDSFLAPVRFHCHLKKVGSETVYYDEYVWCLWVKNTQVI